MGDPVGAARHVRALLADDGTWMIVEPMAGDRVEDNLNPVGRAYYGFSTLLCTPASLSQEVGLALGAQAGEARIRDVVSAGGFTPLPPRRRDAVQPRVRGAAVSTTIDHVGRSDTEHARARARRAGIVERDGVRLHWEMLRRPASPTILLLPAWSIVHSRLWKAPGPVPGPPLPGHHLRRPRQRALRPAADAAAYDARRVRRRRRRRARRHRHRARRASPALSLGGVWTRCSSRPRTPSASLGVVADRPGGPVLTPPRPDARRVRPATRSSTTDEGWAKFNTPLLAARLPRLPGVLLRRDLPGAALDEADRGLRRLGARHDAGDAGREPADLGRPAPAASDGRGDCCRQVRCPVLSCTGRTTTSSRSSAASGVAELTGGELVALRGRGPRAAGARPGAVNLLLREFVDRVSGRPPPRRGRGRAASRARSARCFVSSPIGLGHAWRDVAIADELRRAVPGPRDRVARAGSRSPTVLRARAARRSTRRARELASEAAHIDREAGEHDLHAFQALRRMDEILCANFMLFHDVVREERVRPLDRRRGLGARLLPAREPGAEDRAVRLAHRLRRLPADAGGRRARGVPDRRLQRRDDRARRALPARARPRRSSSATPTTSSPSRFGPGCRRSATGREQHYDFAGYIPGFDPARSTAPRCARELGYGERAGVRRLGRRLRRRRAAAAAGDRGGRRWRASACRTCGRSSSPARGSTRRRCRASTGVEVRGYVHELYRHLAACDVAVVQGGLTTTMELVAAGRPFVAVPLAEPLRAALPRAPPARPLRRARPGSSTGRRARRSRGRDPGALSAPAPSYRPSTRAARHGRAAAIARLL